MSVHQIVDVILRAVGGAAYMQNMRGVASASDVAGSAMARVTSLASPLSAAITAAVGGLTLASVGNLGSQFENTQNKVAGFLTALGETSNFSDGLYLAEQTMRRIEITAAALPGEAEDYTRVFTTALPQVQKSIGGTLDEMVAFTNQITAIGSTFGIDSMQIAHDLQRMLQVGKGGAGLDVRTFTEMLPFLQRVEGQANLNAEAFNKMTEAKRAELLKASFKGLEPMIDNARNSWDAISGTLATTAKTMFRMSTAPLFDGMKRGMTAVSELFYDASGNATNLAKTVIAVGNVVSTGLVTGVEKVVAGIRWLGDNGTSILTNMFSQRLAVFKEAVGMSVDDQGMVTFVGPLADTANSLASAFISLSTVLDPAWQMIETLNAALDEVAITVLPYVADALNSIAGPIADFASGLFGIVRAIVDDVWPVLTNLAVGIGTLVQGIGQFLHPALNIVGAILLKFGSLIREYVVPVISFFAYGIGELAKFIGKFLGAVGENADIAYGFKAPVQSKQASDTFGDMISGMFASIRAARAAKEEKDRTVGSPAKRKLALPSQRSGTKVIQDFRNSRFTIDQKFAEGYDPDRVAVAFAKDVSRMGSQKLQSGFEPLFSVGG